MAENAWHDKGVVVTGAARGIGLAIAERLASEGARLVLADVLEPPLTAAAERLGAVAVPGDAAGADGVLHLVQQARDHLGEIDVWVGNAGIARGDGLLGSTEADWADSWNVNVMAHVRAAQLLVPAWLERGHGRFIVTASAAGLLTILGQPSYAVTKHGAESFAEWLSATYGHRGVAVHAICPQGVLTDMYPGPDTGDDLAGAIGGDGALHPAEVADALVAAVAADQFLVLPHPEVRDYFAFRGANPQKWLRSMQRLQQRAETPIVQHDADQ